MKNWTLFLLNIGFVSLLSAQHEIGTHIGSNHLLGDFGGGSGRGGIFLKDIDFKASRPSFDIFYRYNFLKTLGIRAQVLNSSFYSNDLFTNEVFRSARGLNSRSNVLDASVLLEWNLIPLKFCSAKNVFTPYFALGIGITQTNATVSSQNAEGVSSEETQYIQSGKDIALNLPLVTGIKYKLKQNVVLGLELNYRLAFTDRLDAYVRQENDHFFFLGTSVSYVFCKGSSGLRKRGKQSKCPTFD